MKKLVLAAALCAGLAACNNAAEAPDAAETTPAATATETVADASTTPGTYEFTADGKAMVSTISRPRPLDIGSASASTVVGPLAPSHTIFARTPCAFSLVITFSRAAGTSTSTSRASSSSLLIRSASS